MLKLFLISILFLSCNSTKHDSSVSSSLMTKEQVMVEMVIPFQMQIMADAEYIDRVSSLIPMADLFAEKSDEKSMDIQQISFEDLPEDVDMRHLNTPVKNQGSEGTCTAFGLTAAQEAAHCSAGSCNLDLSERHRWNMYRQYSAVASLRTIDKPISKEEHCPYSSAGCPSNVNSHARFRITGYTMLRSKMQVLAALSQGKQVYFWSQTPQQMVNCSRTISSPKMASGGHAYLVSGYFDKHDPLLIVKNSWGNRCGDSGYQYMSFKIFDAAGYWEAASIDGVMEQLPPNCQTKCYWERRARSLWIKRQYCYEICN